MASEYFIDPSLLSGTTVQEVTLAHSSPPFEPGDMLTCVGIFGWTKLRMGERYTCKRCIPVNKFWVWEVDVEEFNARLTSSEWIRQDAFELALLSTKADDLSTYEMD